MQNRARPKAVPLAVLSALLYLSALSSAQIPSPPSTQVSTTSQTTSAATLTVDDALRLASAQASTFQTAILNERIAAEDVRQAQAAFKPKISAPLGYLYTTPALGLPPGEPRVQSFIANNAIGEYEALLSVSGDFDVAARPRACPGVPGALRPAVSM